MTEEKKEVSNTELIRQIILLEWNMFSKVQNEGGRADCQEEPRTFEIMRGSQFSIWDKNTLISYLKDLQEAEKSGRNLMTEKYGYMMKDTEPTEFKRIEWALPQISKEKMDLINEITILAVSWMEEFQNCYPWYSSQGRPVRKEQAGPRETSMETYTRGELMTYSFSTLTQLAKHWREMNDKGINGAIEIMNCTARQYGYASAEDAEKQLRLSNKS